MAENETSTPEWVAKLREKGRQDALNGKQPEHVEKDLYSDVPIMLRRVYYEGYQQGEKELQGSLGMNDDEG